MQKFVESLDNNKPEFQGNILSKEQIKNLSKEQLSNVWFICTDYADPTNNIGFYSDNKHYGFNIIPVIFKPRPANIECESYKILQNKEQLCHFLSSLEEIEIQQR